jgi:hypothetical protein
MSNELDKNVVKTAHLLFGSSIVLVPLARPSSIRCQGASFLSDGCLLEKLFLHLFGLTVDRVRAASESVSVDASLENSSSSLCNNDVIGLLMMMTDILNLSFPWVDCRLPPCRTG